MLSSSSDFSLATNYEMAPLIRLYKIGKYVKFYFLIKFDKTIYDISRILFASYPTLHARGGSRLQEEYLINRW